MMLWILTSCIAVLAVVGLRFLLRKRLDLRLRYALWLIVLLRLLLPVNFGGSTLSAANLLIEDTPAAVVQTLPAEAPELSSPAQFKAAGQLAPGAPPAAVQAEPQAPAPSASVPAPAAPVLTTRQIHLLVWAFGGACVLLVFLAFNLRLNRRLRRTRELLGNTQALPVYATDAIASPCLYGFFRPAIYLTSDCAADETVRVYCIAHELTHYRHGDHVWAALRILCLILHWYNPLVWWAAVLSCKDAELACDETTVKRLGSARSTDYGRTLVAIACRRPSARNAFFVPAMHFSGNIKERIHLLRQRPKTSRLAVIAAALVLSLLYACAFTGQSAPQDSEPTPPSAANSIDIPQITAPSSPVTEPEPAPTTGAAVQVLTEPQKIVPFSGYTSAATVLETDGKVFYADGNTLCYYAAASADLPSSVLYEGSFTSEAKFFCTDGKTLYLLDNGTDVVSVDVDTKKAELLFSMDAYRTELIGATDTTLYLGTQDSSEDWWGVDICAYDLQGNVVQSYGDDLEGQMKDGVLLLTTMRSDVRPVELLAIDAASNDTIAELTNPEFAWDAVVCNGALYYSFVSTGDEMISGGCTVKRVDQTGTVELYAITPGEDSLPTGFFDDYNGFLRFSNPERIFDIVSGASIPVPEQAEMDNLIGMDNLGALFFVKGSTLYRPDGSGGYFEACHFESAYVAVISILDDVVFYYDDGFHLCTMNANKNYR